MTEIMLGVFIILCPITTSAQLCKNTWNSKFEVLWPETDTKTFSKPFCIGPNMEPISRECKDGQWGPEPDCFMVQKNWNVGDGPQGFAKVGQVYYHFSEASAFPPQCPSPDVLDFKSYKLILPSDSQPFWMPVTRDLRTGIMRWIESGDNYMDEFTDYTTMNGPYGHINCIVHFSQKNRNLAVPCNKTYFGICAYQEPRNSFCGSCTQLDFFDKSSCLCVNKTGEEPIPAEFFQLEQNRIFEYNCSNGLRKLPNGTYMWYHSQKQIDYTFWSNEVVFDDKHIYGASTKDGWTLTETKLGCELTVKKIDMTREPILVLVHMPNNTFELTIFNSDMVQNSHSRSAYCFTDHNPSDPTNVLFKYSHINTVMYTSQMQRYQFEPVSEIPAQYWCEAFRITDAKVVRSNVVQLKVPPEYYEFVVILRYNNSNMATEGLLRKETVEFINVNLLQHLKNDNCTPRLMKLVEDETSTLHIFVNVHVTWKKQESNSEIKEMNKLKANLKTLIQNIDELKFVEILSATTCFKDKEFQWPETRMGSKSFPFVCCLDPKGILVDRQCEGSFTDGAHWSNYSDCQIYNSSEVTVQLLDILRLKGHHFIKSSGDIITISKDFKNIQAWDVTLIIQIFLKIGKVSADFYGHVLDNILSCDEDTLHEAQTKWNSTDRLLDSAKNVVKRLAKSAPSYYDGINSFQLACNPENLIFGVAITSQGRKFIKQQNSSLDDLLSMDDLESALLLSPELLQDPQQSIVFSVFYKNSFFKVTQNMSKIFGVQLSINSTNLQKPIILLHKLDKHSTSKNCMFWNYSKSLQGSWSIKEPKQSNFSAICEFEQSGYFALSDTNVTDDLINLLESNDTIPSIIQRLAEITGRYEYFNSWDIDSVAKILEKVHSSKEMDLQALAVSINNLHKVNAKILWQSQIAHKATDSILFYLDQILQRWNSEDTLETDNFLLTIIDTNKWNITGVALLSEKHSLRMKIINDSSSIHDVVALENFDSAAILDKKLMQQVEKESKIVITVFRTNVLFNEEFASKRGCKVFGVILPPIGDFEGAISILEKSNEFNECGHWNYSRSITGRWAKDSPVKNTTELGLQQCDFYHTTHFALLVVDEDPVENFATLNILTIVTSTLSLTCLVFIVLTAIIFPQWRQVEGNVLLLNYAITLILQISTFFVSSNINKHSYVSCTILGAFLHYCTIAQFVWTLIFAFLQFRRLVIVLIAPPENAHWKACFCGWGLPTIPVFSVLLFDLNTYVESHVGLCYPTDLGLYLGVWLPVVIIMLINAFLFLIIVYNVFCKKQRSFGANKSEIIYQLKFMVLLFFMFGLTWAFAFLSNIGNAPIFLYLFCSTATLQGVVLFVFFIMGNPNTRYMYLRAIKRLCVAQK